jgi:AcrR family transcriptional regulator
MAYEVVKKIGARRYLYRVQSERDPQSGKTRNRWTYLGRVPGEGDAERTRQPRPNARLRLLEAAEGLLAAGDPAAVTADAIASAAGVAHGTFYRYFRDRSDALEALARHIKETRGVADDGLLRDDVVSLEEAQAGVRRWVTEKLQFARERRASLRAWYALISSDARLAAYREERREASLSRLREHIVVLGARGFVDVADPAATAAGLVALIDGIVRASLLERDELGDAGIAAAADIAERALFARLRQDDSVSTAGRLPRRRVCASPMINAASVNAPEIAAVDAAP